MSSAKVQVVINCHPVPETSPIPGVSTKAYPFSAYVLGNPAVWAMGNSQQEVMQKIAESVLGKVSPGMTRKVVELDVSDHMTVSDVMSG